MTDRYERIRAALAMGPTPGPWVDGPLYSVVTQDYCAGKKPVIALVELIPAKLDECMANKSLICACDPDTIRALLAERDDLLENGKQAIRWAPSSAHWSSELKRLFGDDARLGIDALESQLRNAQAERDALREALKECAASLAWNCFGECRAIHAGPIMPASGALELAKAALAASTREARAAIAKTEGEAQ